VGMPARKSKSDTSVTANRMKSGVKRPTAVNHGDEGSPAKKVKVSTRIEIHTLSYLRGFASALLKAQLTEGSPQM